MKRAAALLALPLLAAAGCQEEADTLMPMGLGALRPVPVDATLPGELAEGDISAFGFPIPRKMRVTARYPDEFYCVGRLKLEDVSNYVRARIDPLKIETGPSRTVFLDAPLKDDPKLAVEVSIAQKRDMVQMIVRNRTRVPDEEGEKLSEEERWKRLGLTPDGKVIEKYAE
jgi:hypothetical protein